MTDRGKKTLNEKKLFVIVDFFLLKFHCFVKLFYKNTPEKMALKRLNHECSLLPSEGESFSSENEAHLHCLLKVEF